LAASAVSRLGLGLVRVSRSVGLGDVLLGAELGELGSLAGLGDVIVVVGGEPEDDHRSAARSGENEVRAA
jgi:hypothetical protein